MNSYRSGEICIIRPKRVRRDAYVVHYGEARRAADSVVNKAVEPTLASFASLACAGAAPAAVAIGL